MLQEYLNLRIILRPGVMHGDSIVERDSKLLLRLSQFLLENLHIGHIEPKNLVGIRAHFHGVLAGQDGPFVQMHVDYIFALYGRDFFNLGK